VSTRAVPLKLEKAQGYRSLSDTGVLVIGSKRRLTTARLALTAEDDASWLLTGREITGGHLNAQRAVLTSIDRTTALPERAYY
jgi:hypothetical protein